MASMCSFRRLRVGVLLVYIYVIVVVLAQGTAFGKATEFVESPSNVTVIDGSEEGAVFRCHHSSTDAFINWLINGSRPVSGSGIITQTIDENGTLVDTLTIPATSDFSGSQVVCVASTVNGREETPPATLTVIAGPPTTTEPTTTEVKTTEKPTPISKDNFIEVPSPLLLIVTAEERYVYMCNNSATNRIFWTVNGSKFGVDILPAQISTGSTVLPGGNLLYTLTIGGLPEHNETRIQCVAQLSDGTIDRTPMVLFKMQGRLQGVGNLSRSFRVISWDTPFSLNLTNVEPDIVYCVMVYNITCGRSLVISDCDVLKTGYSSDDLRPGYIYEYTVTPRSNVEGAQNGTSLTETEKFIKLKQSVQGHSVRVDTKFDVKIPLEVTQLEGGVRADFYQISLYSSDSYNISDDAAMKNETFISFRLTLPSRKLWNFIVYAYDCGEHPVLEATQLSTYDLQNISVISTRPGEILVTGDIIPNSGVTGVLVIIISKSEQLYRLIPPQSNYNALYFEDTLTGVAGGEYSVSLFVVEESELPLSGAASWPKLVSVRKSNEPAEELPIKYEVQSTSTSVCITCTFLESSTATDCVAVVHQRISQLNSTGLRNIDSHKFTRSGDTASGCIEGVNLEDYQVGVISVNTEVEITDPPTEEGGEVVPQRCDSSCVAVASVVAVSLCLCVVLLVAILALLYRRKLKSKKLRLHATMRSNSPESNVYTRVDIGQEVVKDQCEAQSTSAGAKDSGYADIMDFKSDSLKPLPQRDNVVYDDIQGFRNPSGQHYALLGLQGEPGDKPDDLSAVVYSEVKAPAAPTEPEQDPSETKQDLSSPTTTTTPFDLEHLLSELMGVASKWKDLGEALLLDDDLLDEIYTNNETDEACLQDMLEKYLMRIDGNHSWEDMHAALRKINQEEREAVHRSEDVESISSEPLVKGKEVDTLVKENDHVGSDNLFNHATESSHQSESHLIINTTQLEQAHDQRQDDQEPDLWQGNGHTDADVGDSHAPDSERTLHTSIMAAIN